MPPLMPQEPQLGDPDDWDDPEFDDEDIPEDPYGDFSDEPNIRIILGA